MRNKGLVILITISVVFSLFFIIGFLLPGTFTSEQKVSMDTHFSHIYPLLEDLETWENWSAWNKSKDSTLHIFYPGKTKGEGAIQQWNGEIAGKGKLTLTECVPEEGIRYKLNFDDRLDMNGRIYYADTTANRTDLMWTMTGDLGMNPIFRYFGLLMDGMIAPDLKEGLDKLKIKVEK